MKKIMRYSTVIAIISLVLTGSLFAQDPVSKNELESVLGRFSNYRYGTVSIYKFKNDDITKIRETLKEYEAAESGEADATADVLKNVDPRIITKLCVMLYFSASEKY